VDGKFAVASTQSSRPDRPFSLVVRDTVLYGPSIVAAAVSSLALTAGATRVLTALSYGRWATVQALFNIMQVLATTWLSTTLLRFYPAAAQERKSDLAAGALTAIVTATVLVALTVGTAIAVHPSSFDAETRSLLNLVPAQVFAYGLLTLGLQFLRAERRIGAYTVVSISRAVAVPSIAVGLALLLPAAGAIGLSVGSAASLGLIAVPALWFSLPDRHRWRASALTTCRELAGYGLPLVPSAVMGQVLDVSDRLLIGATRGPVEAGLYTVGYTTAILPLEFLIAILAAATPVIVVVHWETRGAKPVAELLSRLLAAFIYLSVPLVITLTFLGRQAIGMVATPSYAGASRIVFPVAMGGVLLGIQWVYQRSLLLRHRTKSILLMFIASALVNTGLNLWLVPRYGYESAAWTTFASYAFLCAMMARASRRLIGPLLRMRTLLGLGVGGTFMFLSTQGSQLILAHRVLVDDLVCVVLGLLAYAGTLAAIPSARREVLELLHLARRACPEMNASITADTAELL
jgi:O-antigen/teichoic acid export membrane protein